MRARAVTAAGVLVALAPAVNAVGQAIIHNTCHFDVYLNPVGDGYQPGMTTLPARTGKWSAPYQKCASGGVSLKLSDDPSLVHLTQFEYTLGETIWYDVSNVNCGNAGQPACPFASEGMFLQGGDGCPDATCKGGVGKCHDAYNLFNDDWATHMCDAAADTTLYLCSETANIVHDVGSIVQGAADTVNGLIGDIIGGGSKNHAANSPAAQSPTYQAPPPPAATPTPASTPKPYVPPAKPSTSSPEVAAPVPTTPTTPAGPPPTTLTVVPVPAPTGPVIVTEYATVTTMVSTAVVYEHAKYHKEKRAKQHPHARRHQHQE